MRRRFLEKRVYLLRSRLVIRKYAFDQLLRIFFFNCCVPTFSFNSPDGIPGIYWHSEIPLGRTQTFVGHPKVWNVNYFIS